MAGNRIDMIERAAARLRRDAPEQKPAPTTPVLPEKSTIATAGARATIGLSPLSPRFIPAPKLTPAADRPAQTPLSPPVLTPADEPAVETSVQPAADTAAAPAFPATDIAPPPLTVADRSPAFVETKVEPPSPIIAETDARPPADVSAALRSLAPAEPPVPANESTGEASVSIPAPVRAAQPLAAPEIEANKIAVEPDIAISPALPEEAPIEELQAKHSRTVVLDTARLALAGTIDWSSDRTPVMEELRLIKRRLLRRAFNPANGPDSISHLVMITSAKPREGKTFTSTNIAISISLEEDYNVLLVDADIRRQALRQNLGLEANQGFVDLLLNPSLDMADVLLRTNIPRLSVLPAGTMSDRAPELLASSRMRDLIDDMAQRYRDRIILFDTAPCLVSSDAATLAAHVGQVVFVIEAEQTQQHEIVAALNLISACPDISLVLNKAQPLATTSYGGYGAY